MPDIESANKLAVAVDGLTKRYGEFLAVDHISFEVRWGEYFSFLGTNGDGNVATVRMMNTLPTPVRA